MTTSIYPSGYDAFVDPPRPSEPGIPGTLLSFDHIDAHLQLIDAVKALQTHVGSDGETAPASVEQRLAGVIAAAAAAADEAAIAAADAISALANAALASIDLADHETDTGAHDIAATVATAIAAHESALDPHAGYALEADLGAAALLDVGTAPGTVAAGDDPRFGTGGLSEEEADLLYAPIAKGVTNGDSHNHDGGDGAQIAYASLSGPPTLGTAAATASTAYATSAQGANADSHASNTSNPHAVSKTQVGLGSVDNTSDASKPVSTAQQTALNLKANLASPTFTGTVVGITAAMVGAPSGSGTSTGTNTGNETPATLGTVLGGATSKTTPIDADRVGLWNSVSGLLEYLSWANLKTGLSSVFVTLAGASQTLSGKVGLGVTPTEKLSVAGNVNISGSYLYGNSAVGPVEVYGFFTDFTGYGQGGLPALVPGSFDRLMFLDKKGGTITSSITPATGAETLVNIVDGTAAFANFDATGSPVVITMTLESAYSNQRDFSIIFYKGYAPSRFTVQFYDASNALLGEDVQTAWPSTQSVYVFKTGISFYGTKKVIITLNAPKSGYSYYHIFSVFWSNYGFPQSPSSVNRKFGGDVYVGLNVAVNAGSLGVGTSAPSAKIHAIATTEQLRCGYDAANYWCATTSSAGVPTFNATGNAFVFNGDIRLDKTVTAGGTTGAQTINKPIGSVNFAAGASSLVVTNSLVTTSSVITATVGTNDATMKSVAVVAAAGSFTLHATAAATAETRVNFQVFN